MEREYEMEKKKLKEKNKLLNKLIQQYELFSQKLKNSLKDEKNKNVELNSYVK